MAIIIVFLMLASSLLAIVQTIHDGPEATNDTQLVQGGSLGMSPVQSTDQGGQGGGYGGGQGGGYQQPKNQGYGGGQDFEPHAVTDDDVPF